MNTLRVIPHLVRLQIKRQMEYRADFWLSVVALIIGYIGSLAAIWLILNRFDNIAGWTWPQAAFLFSFQLLSYASGASFSFVQMYNLEEEVRLGKFDTILVKPFSPWAFVVFSRYEISYLAHITLAVSVMIWSLTQVAVEWDLGNTLFFGASIISGAMVFASVLTMIGALSFILVKSRYIFSLFFSFWELTRYPISILPLSMQVFLFTLMPLGYINYAPASYLLGKDAAFIGEYAVYSPLAGPICLLLTMAFWRFAINRYQSAGG